MPEGLLLVLWSSIGLWVGLVCGSEGFTLRWIELGWISRLVGWVEEIGPTDNSVSSRWANAIPWFLQHTGLHIKSMITTTKLPVRNGYHVKL